MSIPSDFATFSASLAADMPDELWPEALKALWYDGKGDWNGAHNIAQDIPTVMGSWIHAYLHRKEGDKWNAGYWYGRANREFPSVGLEMEFKELVSAVIRSCTF
ncbi:MAG: hypothetical protein KJN96_01645 [Eudoraea sp.]|nr:hypothetical protein [Eudoraea sp.]